MRVFILSTGRSGSNAFIEACQHIENFTSGHESLSRSFGPERFDYPDNHVEADNRLSWHLGSLHKLFGDETFYVHLKRDRDKVAQSFMKRFYSPGSIIDSFSEGLRKSQPENLSKESRLAACYDYVDTVNSNIEHFVDAKINTMSIDLENIDVDFTEFWKRIDARGKLEDALEEFKKRHNATTKRKLKLRKRFKLAAKREWRHIVMSMMS
ncbi:MAG: hypothetical protein ABFS32_10795 [Bacteroidota bacterium]